MNKPKIISASRRTDIPAFYSRWMLNRLQAGWALTCNPYNRRAVSVSLRPSDVAGIVFWSKNFGPLLKHLPQIDAMGYRCFFIFTITGLPPFFEPGVTSTEESIATLKSLARCYSPHHVQWRYDPILLSTVTDPDYHLRTFRALCQNLEGYTYRCFTSFATLYVKVRRRLAGLVAGTGIRIRDDTDLDEKKDLAVELARVAGQHGIRLYSCCNDFLVNGTIQKGHCIDATALAPLFGLEAGLYRPKPTREQCGCDESVDIGMYETCPHLCAYCYANTGTRRVLHNFGRYNPTGPALPGVSPKGKAPTVASPSGNRT